MPDPLSRRTLVWMLAIVGGTLVTSDRARADSPTLRECVAANEQAGPLRKAGRVREARANMLRCTAPSCPALVRDDCIKSATALEAAVPTIVFAVQDAAGNELRAVVVSMDGEPLVGKLDGTAVEVDPGEHLFRFDVAGAGSVDKPLVIREGEKNRQERILLGVTAPAGPTPPPPASPTPPPPSASLPATTPPPSTAPASVPSAQPGGLGGQRVASLVIAGAGIAAIGVGSVFGWMAHAQWEQAKTDCGAGCPPSSQAQSEAGSAHTAATVADVTYGLGGAAIIAGVVLWVLAPSSKPTTALSLAPFSMGAAQGAGGVGIAASGRLP